MGVGSWGWSGAPGPRRAARNGSFVTRAAARSSAKPKAAARDRWQQQAAADSEARRSGGCSDADEYVRSAMGGRDCSAVAVAGDCEMIRALGEPNLVCACSCLPRDRASLPPTSILGGTGFIMRDLKTLLRGVAAKACLIGPQMMRQTEGKQGHDALDECDHLDEKDFENVPHYLSPKLPQVRPSPSLRISATNHQPLALCRPFSTVTS